MQLKIASAEDDTSHGVMADASVAIDTTSSTKSQVTGILTEFALFSKVFLHFSSIFLNES
jgi:hypothetical protein